MRVLLRCPKGHALATEALPVDGQRALRIALAGAVLGYRHGRVQAVGQPVLQGTEVLREGEAATLACGPCRRTFVLPDLGALRLVLADRHARTLRLPSPQVP